MEHEGNKAVSEMGLANRQVCVRFRVNKECEPLLAEDKALELGQE